MPTKSKPNSKVAHLHFTTRALLEKWLEMADDIDEVMILGKKEGKHMWESTELDDVIWWLGLLEHAKAEMNLDIILTRRCDAHG